MTYFGSDMYDVKIKTFDTWSSGTPSAYENVWVPEWKKVILDESTPVLGHVIVEGVLIINGTNNIELSCVYLVTCFCEVFKSMSA